MKRYVAFDFLRGCAIMGVIGFHILNQAYNKDQALESAVDSMNIPFILLAMLLYFLGSFFPLFIALSGLVNIISVDGQWNKMISKDSSPEGIKLAYKTILTGQIIRGLFVVFMGYFSEVILNGGLLDAILQETDILNKMVQTFFFTQILVMIGLGVIIVSSVYLTLLKKGKTKQEITKIFWLISLSILVLTPIMIEILKFLPDFWDRPGNTWQSRNFFLNLLYVILTPLVIDFNPLFPNLAAMFIGSIIGFTISSGKIDKKFLKSMSNKALLMFFIGTILRVLGVALSLPFDEYNVPEFLVTTGGSLIVMLLVIYYIDFRGKGEKFAKKTTFFRRFGIMTLTLWCIQWLVVIPVYLIQTIANLITHTAESWLDGPILNEGLNGYELIGVIFIVLMFYHLILWSWQKIQFKWSLEWITVKLLSSKREDAGLRLTETLTNTQSIVQASEKDVETGGIYEEKTRGKMLAIYFLRFLEILGLSFIFFLPDLLIALEVFA